MKIREHGDDSRDDCADGGWGGAVRFSHDGLHHEVGGVGFDDVGGWWGADYMGEVTTEAGGSHGAEVGRAGIAVGGDGQSLVAKVVVECVRGRERGGRTSRCRR